MSPFKAALFFVLISLAAAPDTDASVYVDVDDEAYAVLERLEALGVISSGLLSIKPLSRAEIVRLAKEAERNMGDDSLPYAKAAVRRLIGRFGDKVDAYFDPFEDPVIGYIQSDGGETLSYNNRGDVYEDGGNLRAGFSARVGAAPLDLEITPEFRYGDGGGSLTLMRAYGVVDLWGMDLMAGRDSGWWGPGEHGSILLSDNAEPLTQLRLSNPQPAVLPWVFKYLGQTRLTLFASRLESDRAVPNPYLWGMRLDMKPFRHFEVSLQRTALLGGEGRDESPGAWWDSIVGKGENTEDTESDTGDQRAGVGFKLTLPLGESPVQVYMDAAGEDEAGGLPSRWAYIAGLYMPRLPGLEQTGIRVEYTDTYVKSAPGTWYNHHVYSSGYTYKGRIIGHHTGSDAKDLYVEVNYYLPGANGRITVSYDREEHIVAEGKNPLFTEASLGGIWETGVNASLGGRLSIGRVEDPVSGDEDTALVMLNLMYRF